MSRTVRTLLAALSILLLAYLALALLPRTRPPHPLLERLPDRVLVIAHQGGDGLWPSNTLYAFERAAALGVDMLEMDIHASADGHLVVIHDDTVERTTDGEGSVAELTLEQLGSLDAGHDWSPEREGETFPYRGLGIVIPTLTEVLSAFPDMPLVLEIKPDSEIVARQLCSALRGADAGDRVLVGSFHRGALDAFRRDCPEIATSAAPNEVRNFFVASLARLGTVYRPPIAALQVPEYQGDLRLVDRSFVRAAEAGGMAVHVWTVDRREDMVRLIDLGVDGLITDRPDRALQELGREVRFDLPAGVPR